MLAFIIAISGLTIAISLYTVSTRLGAIADAIREAGRR